MFWHGHPEYTKGKVQSLQQMVLVKMDIHTQKNEIELISRHTKLQLKMD